MLAVQTTWKRLDKTCLNPGANFVAGARTLTINFRPVPKDIISRSLPLFWSLDPLHLKPSTSVALPLVSEQASAK